MAHTHRGPDGEWYSICFHCQEKYGGKHGHCRCGGDPYMALDNAEEKVRRPFGRYHDLLPDPFDVEPSSDPPDPDEAYELAREERIERERMEYDILHERLEDL